MSSNQVTKTWLAQGGLNMVDPFILFILALKVAITKAVAAHAAAAHAAAAQATAAHAAAAPAAVVTGIAGTAHAFVFGTQIEATTLAGITFVNLYNNVLNDLYKRFKRGLSPEQIRVARDYSYRQTWEFRDKFTPDDVNEVRRIYDLMV
jgi:hypothetical protein